MHKINNVVNIIRNCDQNSISTRSELVAVDMHAAIDWALIVNLFINSLVNQIRRGFQFIYNYFFTVH